MVIAIYVHLILAVQASVIRLEAIVAFSPIPTVVILNIKS